jgi:ABC-type Fe3+ transport system permease subunit
MVFGWGTDRVTLPISLYAEWSAESDGSATRSGLAAIALAAITLALAIAYNRSTHPAEE